MRIANLSDKELFCLESDKAVYSDQSFNKYFQSFKTFSTIKHEKHNELLSSLQQISSKKNIFITEAFKYLISDSSGEYLVIIVSPGSSPLSIKLLKDFDANIFKILEIDNNLMEEKQEIYDVEFNELSGKIKCIGLDKYKSTLATIVNLIKDYYKDYPIVLICDSVMCSDVINEIKYLVECLKSGNKTNALIIDYLNSHIDDLLNEETQRKKSISSDENVLLFENIINAGASLVMNEKISINFSSAGNIKIPGEFQLSLWKI